MAVIRIPRPATRTRIAKESPTPARTKGRSQAKAATSAARGGPSSVEGQVQQTLTALKRVSTKRDYENLARFGITTTKAFGVSMANTSGWRNASGAATSSPPSCGRPVGTRRVC
jgi:hypothetical protein